MIKQSVPQSLLLCLLVYADFTHTKVYYITPSLGSSCPENIPSCITLSQFAADSSNHDADIKLLLLSGYHTLDQELLAHGYNISISRYAKDNETVFVECISHIGRFHISETTSASINGLNFIGCCSNIVSRVKWLTIADSTFQGAEDISTVLLISEVTFANIVRSQFLKNRLEHYNRTATQFAFLHSKEVVLAYIYQRNSSSGVLYTIFSNVSVVSCKFMYNRADIGGAFAAHNSSLHIDMSTISYNKANHGGAMVTSGSTISIDNSSFTHNSARGHGGVMVTYNDRVNISSSAFTTNKAMYLKGGVIIALGESSFAISISNFASNFAWYNGGVMSTWGHSSFTVSNSNFTSNSADFGGVIDTSGDSLFTISNSKFASNSATFGGVMHTSGDSSFTISNSDFSSNSAQNRGGVMFTFDDSFFTISNSNFTSNSAKRSGGVISTDSISSFTIGNSKFTFNNAEYSGGVMYVSRDSSININKSNFTSNSATSFAGLIHCTEGTLSTYINIDNCSISSNTISTLGGGLIFISQCPTNITNTTFDDNVGSIYTFNSNLTFSGISKVKNSTKLLNHQSITQEGGVITSFQSTVTFAKGSSSHFSNSAAIDGGVMLAIESTIIVYGTTTLANNNITTFANSNGGCISLKQSRLEIKGKCNLVNNSAVRGGGIHATGSSIVVYSQGSLQLITNNADFGGGLYLEVNSKLYVLKTSVTFLNEQYFISFIGNQAKYGGAVYVADDTNSGTCLPANECFIQSLALYQDNSIFFDTVNIKNIHLSNNSANVKGSNLFGGLLDRCISSPFAEAFLISKHYYLGVTYLQDITNKSEIHSISSQPVRVCFCNSEHEPDCSYQPPTITVKKGEAFNVSVVAVDQVNYTVDANVTIFISSSDGGFGEGQQTQSVGRNCKNLTYNVFSSYDSETINLFADGPCGNAALSTSHITINFNECVCPVGFELLSNSKSSIRCECVCDSKLFPYITDCNHATAAVFRIGTNSWISYTNNTDSPGYVIYPYCPFDYCKLLTENVSINFNIPNGANIQCAYNRTGVLCGSCIEKSSLSLASSRCLPCHSHWPAVSVVIILAAILAGILLVAALLALNMTVSVGLINSFIFYTNIVSAGKAVFFPTTEPSFPSVFVAWLNLEIGIDVCFIDGLDAYIKTWLELAFPVYIIVLVVMVIKISEHSPKFARLMARKDPVSTLATLVMLSYAKLLSVTITALSFATLDYPDGKREIVWLPDGNVKYFQGKHIPLTVVALLIILIGLPFTILLFLWQWIVRAPRWKVFKWLRSSKFNAFITTYHVPLNSKYRYWVGMLLLVRVILYVTASITVSANPQTFPLIANILIGGLFLLSKIFSLRVYRKTFVDAVDTVLYFNLLALIAFSQYDFKIDATKQTSVAYTSTAITFILFIGSISYHVKLLIIRKKPRQDLNKYLLPSIQTAKPEVTYSVIEPPKHDQDPPPIKDSNESTVSENCLNLIPSYILMNNSQKISSNNY